MDNFGYSCITRPTISIADSSGGRHLSNCRFEFRQSDDGAEGSPLHFADMKTIQPACFDLEEHCTERKSSPRESRADAAQVTRRIQKPHVSKIGDERLDLDLGRGGFSGC